MHREMDFPAVADALVPTDRPRRLHLGCGDRFHPAWINLDLHPQHPSVRAHDVTAPLPFADLSIDAVYHAHLLEHLPRADALPFLRECLRVLRPGGILRVVVPDLEQIARLYLDSLDGAWQGDADAERRHAWSVLEMYDQVVRDQPGGAMVDYLRGADASDLAWYRIGADGRIIRQHLERIAPPPEPPRRARRLVNLCRGWRERLIRWLLGREYALLQRARFRAGGEVHMWMYDRHSLRALVTAAGFGAFRLTAAGESRILGWADGHLDTLPDGTAAKPDSLYAEAVRP
jgi:predicted SAM-dependent methyltransferase